MSHQTDSGIQSGVSPFLHPFVATQARQRMTVICGSTLLFAFYAAGMEVMLPLWVTRELGYPAATWAQLRSLRMTGVLVGIIILGALSDRFGQRRLGAISMWGVAGTLLAFSYGRENALWISMPIFGAMVSTAYVNLNTLTQGVSQTRQGMANAIYRSIGAAAGIVAPLVVTSVAITWGGYPPVFTALAGILIAAGLILFLYPGEATPPPLSGFRSEIKQLWAGYRLALTQNELVRFICLSELWGNLMAGVGTFAAIRFTLQLHQTDQAFGLLGTISGSIALIGILIAGFFLLDRVSLRLLMMIVCGCASICAVLLGLTDSVIFTAILLCLTGPLAAMTTAPVSMWVSRAAGSSTQASAFSLHKVITAAFVATSTAILGILEPLIGMKMIFFAGGCLSFLIALCFLLLREPRQTYSPE